MKEGRDVYFSLGSNLGDKKVNLDTAISLMERYFGIKATKIATYIQTEPWGFQSEDLFLNTVVLFNLNSVGKNTEEHCYYILDICKKIEKEMGRTEKILYNKDGKRQYFSRIIDIDILYYSDESMTTERLIVPHPHIQERDFVLIPLREIAKRELIKAYPYILK